MTFLAVVYVVLVLFFAVLGYWDAEQNVSRRGTYLIILLLFVVIGIKLFTGALK